MWPTTGSGVAVKEEHLTSPRTIRRILHTPRPTDPREDVVLETDLLCVSITHV